MIEFNGMSTCRGLFHAMSRMFVFAFVDTDVIFMGDNLCVNIYGCVWGVHNVTVIILESGHGYPS